MSFETDGPVPDWVTERFDAQTQLPIGPLEHLPIPVEGRITSASSCIPNDGGPASWNVLAICAEEVIDTRKFFEEYLPLAGYVVVASGRSTTRRWWGAKTEPTEVLVIRRGPFIGTVTMQADSAERRTSIAVSMGTLEHPQYRHLATPESMRSMTDMHWRLAP